MKLNRVIIAAIIVGIAFTVVAIRLDIVETQNLHLSFFNPKDTLDMKDSVAKDTTTVNHSQLMVDSTTLIADSVGKFTLGYKLSAPMDSSFMSAGAGIYQAYVGNDRDGVDVYQLVDKNGEITVRVQTCIDDWPIDTVIRIKLNRAHKK